MFRLGQIVIRNGQKVKAIELRRCLSAAPQTKRADAQPSAADKKPNMSFLTNIFRGEVQPAQIFPYPDVMDAEQKEFTSALVDPVTKFFEEVNDPVKNDTTANLDETTLNALWELGAFSLQVPPELGGLGLNNTQYSRMCDIIGGQDLGLGICIGAHQSIGFKCIDQFSQTIETLLMKHGKGIVERQFILARIADSAIDIYTMASVLSRATRAVRKGLPSAEHEVLMTQAWCLEGHSRVQQNIQRIKSEDFQKNYQKMALIAKNICANQGAAHTNPLEVD